MRKPLKAVWRTPSKYRAQPTTVDGIRFHSKREAERYQELKLLQKAGEIVGEIELQPVFPLSVRGLYEPGVDHVVARYIADFRYVKKDGEIVIEDVKGFRTRNYVTKKKLIEVIYGITVTEVR